MKVPNFPKMKKKVFSLFCQEKLLHLEALFLIEKDSFKVWSKHSFQVCSLVVSSFDSPPLVKWE